ncbi:MAG: helix-turn-helix domain-containing protein [Acidobacteriota bacterium]|nr:helix-turn-helix domain-containing protein [Acidobacteriota bacterium]
MKMNTDKNWILKKAAQEDGALISVGGLVEALEPTEQASNVVPIKHAFTRFLQLARRERELSLDQFAQRVDVDLAELLKMETDEAYTPALRTVHKIAEFFKVPEQPLMALAGLLKVKDAQFQHAALKFAARSESVEKLSPEEHSALEEYVNFLCQR